MKLLSILYNLHSFASLPSWERGLKFDLKYSPYASLVVAPLVGAWIEIEGALTFDTSLVVAPLVGAWIEIL